MRSGIHENNQNMHRYYYNEGCNKDATFQKLLDITEHSMILNQA